jgi:hypothetical protein
MTKQIQQDLLALVTKISRDDMHSRIPSELVVAARALVAQANRVHTIRDAVNDVVARYGHYANGICIVELALAEMTVGKGGDVFVRPEHKMGVPLRVSDSDGFQKARANDDKALTAFVPRQ